MMEITEQLRLRDSLARLGLWGLLLEHKKEHDYGVLAWAVCGEDADVWVDQVKKIDRALDEVVACLADYDRVSVANTAGSRESQDFLARVLVNLTRWLVEAVDEAIEAVAR